MALSASAVGPGGRTTGTGGATPWCAAEATARADRSQRSRRIASEAPCGARRDLDWLELLSVHEAGDQDPSLGRRQRANNWQIDEGASPVSDAARLRQQVDLQHVAVLPPGHKRT